MVNDLADGADREIVAVSQCFQRLALLERQLDLGVALDQLSSAAG